MTLPFPNPTSLSEGKKIFIYPSTESGLREEIPLWMKFFCYEYNSSSLGRASAYNRSQNLASIPTMTNLKAVISVPAPPNFVTTTQHTYKSEEVVPPDDVLSGIVDAVKRNMPASVSGWFQTLLNSGYAQMVAGALGKAKVASSRLGYNQVINKDETDLVYKPGGSLRQFDIQLYLPCLNIEDSRIAGDIIRAFEALSLPTVLSFFRSRAATVFFHPPLWVFGIGALDNYSFDPDWSGYPQLSVLRTVKVKRVAIDTNTLAAIGSDTESGIFKPIAYSLTLTFQELEPSVRITGNVGELSTLIQSRSSAVITTGTKNPLVRDI